MKVGDMVWDDFCGYGVVIGLEAADEDARDGLEWGWGDGSGLDSIAIIYFISEQPHGPSRIRRWAVDHGLEEAVVSQAPRNRAPRARA